MEGKIEARSSGDGRFDVQFPVCACADRQRKWEKSRERRRIFRWTISARSGARYSGIRGETRKSFRQQFTVRGIEH